MARKTLNSLLSQASAAVDIAIATVGDMVAKTVQEAIAELYGGKEPTLPTVPSNGRVLSSTVGGVRTWIEQSSGGSGDFVSPLTSSEISITGATSATIGRMHVCSGTGDDYTVTLPAASGNAGKMICFRMATGLTKLVTLDGNNSELIDGYASRVMWAGESAILLCDGTGWSKIMGTSIPFMCRLTPSALSTFANSTVNKIVFDTSAFPSTIGDTTNNKIVIRRGGIYCISLAIAFHFSNASNTTIDAILKKNSAPLSEGLTASLANQYASANVQILNTALAAGDALEGFGYYTTGTYTTQTTMPAGTSLEAQEVITW